MVNRVQKVLETANIKLASVASNILIDSPVSPSVCASGQKMTKVKSKEFFWWLMLVLVLQTVGVKGENARQSVSCPRDVKTLTDLMLRDLPSYANRVIQRAIRPDSTVQLSTYVIIAGRPEFQPLPLPEIEYKSLFPDQTQQFFFTTLERQYNQTRVIEMQNFHWLFLTETTRGWQVFTVFSQLASLNGEPPLPPQDTSKGIIGQAIKLWLRDCEAGTLRNIN